VNYFSHFWVDYQEQDYYYNTGLIIPDFARKHVKSFLKSPKLERSTLQSLHNGCMAHYFADKKFHNSTFFKQLLELSNQLMTQAPFSERVLRKWFLAHILVELMLDRLLVKEHVTQLDDFYDSLNNVAEVDIFDYLTLFGAKDVDLFLEYFNHFRSVKYIYYYTDNIKFVYSLNKIMVRAGVGELTEADQNVLLKVVLKLENELSRNTANLFKQLKYCIHG
jgi:hypothetical protein